MTDSQVIARKFRPQTFDQVVGQEAITRTLNNALTTGRIHHAYLFTGARGVGKTTTARILAKCLNCIKGITNEPCGVCDSCRDITASRSIDVLEIDAASNTGVDNVRDVIINSISIAPARDRHKIFIIDEVHMLSNAAFNALLKTLEEPPPRVVFIMATTELQKVPETILSRCQVFEFRTITQKKIFDQLRHIADQEKITITDSALMAIARAGEGSMRDAESALDQVISFAGNNVSDEDVSAALGLVDIETLNVTVKAIAEQDSQALLRIVDEVVTRGYDIRNFCRELMVHTRALLVVKISGFDAELIQMSQSDGHALAQLADSFSEQDLMRFFAILTKTEQDIRTSSQPRFQLEIGLMKLAHARRLYLLEDALAQIAELQSRLGGAGVISSGGASPATPAQGSGRSGPSTSGPRSTPRAMQEVAAEPPRFASRPQSATTSKPASESAIASRPPESKAEGRIEMPDPFAQSSQNAEATASRSRQTLPPEPPPIYDEPYDVEEEFPPTIAQSNLDGSAAVEKIKAALETKNKMLLAMMLAHADVKIDGDYLRVAVKPENARDKTQLDAKDKKQIIEEAAREVVGRKLTVSVSVVGQPVAEESTRPKAAPRAKRKAEEDPRVVALKDKFRGEVVEVKEPER
ncbi:MAG TPA: DNA polymerase III subunit gamma/tau [Blastocatellia bacterium]|nr:DNA polymerase III subunit gamma/tau [Blastocatellia bacterium]